MARAVTLRGAPSTWLADVAERASAAAIAGPGGTPDLGAALGLARDLGDVLGDAADAAARAHRWQVLATLGAVDLTVARAVEPHLDAVAILHEAQEQRLLADTCTWGVYAAEGPRRLRAQRDREGWSLEGEKPWCSLAGSVSHALLTAWVDDDRRALFAVRLDDPGIFPLDGPGWVARGLSHVTSTGLRLDDVWAEPVGGPGWYLERPGFWWGGVGVAAVWYGATVAVARRLREACARREPDQVALLHLGRVDTLLATGRAALREAAEGGDAEPSLVAARTRQVVADAAAEVLDVVGRALGPGPLATEEEHARRVADLQLYLRQHHAERDLARQGELVLTGRPW